MFLGGRLRIKFLISPYVTASRFSAMQSMCQLERNVVPGSMTCHAWRMYSLNERSHNSRSTSTKSGNNQSPQYEKPRQDLGSQCATVLKYSIAYPTGVSMVECLVWGVGHSIVNFERGVNNAMTFVAVKGYRNSLVAPYSGE